MNRPLESALALSFLIVGVSHIIQARRWSDFFVDLFATRAAAFAIAMYTFPVGLLLVLGHNYWAWDLSVIATVYGWASLFKGSLYFLFPDLPMKVSSKKVRVPRHFVVAGAVMTVIGALLTYDCIAKAV